MADDNETLTAEEQALLQADRNASPPPSETAPQTPPDATTDSASQDAASGDAAKPEPAAQQPKMVPDAYSSQMFQILDMLDTLRLRPGGW